MQRYPQHIQDKLKELGLDGLSEKEILRLAIMESEELKKELDAEQRKSVEKAQNLFLEKLSRL